MWTTTRLPTIILVRQEYVHCLIFTTLPHVPKDAPQLVHLRFHSSFSQYLVQNRPVFRDKKQTVRLHYSHVHLAGVNNILVSTENNPIF